MYALPPVNEGGLGDSPANRDRSQFFCDSVSGAVDGQLICNRLFPDLNWDREPQAAYITISTILAAGAVIQGAGTTTTPTAGVEFELATPPRIVTMSETCDTLPLPEPGALKPAFTGSFAAWKAECSSASQILPGTSFALTISSVGTLTTDGLGADPLDASADGFDWDGSDQEILSNSFHGKLTATLVAADSGAPIHVEMTF
jgi:hypothetical protein